MTPEEIRQKVKEELNKQDFDKFMQLPKPIQFLIEKTVDLTIHLMQKNCISIEEHNKVIDKTKELMQEEQKKDRCKRFSCELLRDFYDENKKLLEERQKLKVELPERWTRW
jgi:3-hydroxy-3-methylglutaryl CoA synthase